MGQNVLTASQSLPCGPLIKCDAHAARGQGEWPSLKSAVSLGKGHDSRAFLVEPTRGWRPHGG